MREVQIYNTYSTADSCNLAYTATRPRTCDCISNIALPAMLYLLHSVCKAQYICMRLLEENFNNQGWVREGNVPPPTQSAKLKIIYGLKMSNTSFFYPVVILLLCAIKAI